MSPKTIPQPGNLGEHPRLGARPAIFLLIALLTALIVLAHSLELGIAPFAALACFLSLAALTGGLVVYVFAHRSGRS
ncbi:MAG: hypothetical protein RMK99_08785 [Anaerolineales bacterium]|nr:hypothetical protein [Anaerolineales bacterium]